MKELTNAFQTYSNALNAKILATMEVYAMGTLFVVNVERERATLPLAANSTTDMTTVVQTAHPIPEHAQSEKRKRNLNCKTH